MTGRVPGTRKKGDLGIAVELGHLGEGEDELENDMADMVPATFWSGLVPRPR